MKFFTPTTVSILYFWSSSYSEWFNLEVILISVSEAQQLPSLILHIKSSPAAQRVVSVFVGFYCEKLAVKPQLFYECLKKKNNWKKRKLNYDRAFIFYFFIYLSVADYLRRPLFKFELLFDNLSFFISECSCLSHLWGCDQSDMPRWC